MASTSTPAEKSQYHHFIPRFILRNYSHPVATPPNSINKQGKARRNGSRVPEPLLWGINLSGAEAQLTETTVAKTFGVTDMYRDSSTSTKQHAVEEQLSVLESHAGRIISQIRKAFEAGKPDVWITRTERDALRKFLFIMKYRGSRFYRRYNHEKAEDYNENDTEMMLSYMKEKKIKRPIDVWYDNIKGILDLKMDVKGEWMEKIEKRIYPHDAQWFVSNLQQFYMALATPFDAEGEFLLTQNAYSIHEGASSQKFNFATGMMEDSAYSEFHLFAPISPRLLIVLRTNILPVPEEDHDPKIKRQREMTYKSHAIQHTYPLQVGQLLRDLPIGKARNSYSSIVGGGLVMNLNGMLGAKDTYCFRFFPILENYVDKINGIMLEESHSIDLIVLNNKTATQKTISTYLAKRSESDLDSNRARSIQKLRQAANLLGADLPPTKESTVPLNEQSSLAMTPEIAEFLKKQFAEDKVYGLFAKNKKATELYVQLSGKPLDRKDFDQARGLLYMRIKLESRTLHLNSQAREDARTDFTKIYKNFPMQVIWIYLKRIRFMKLGGTSIIASGILEDRVLPPSQLNGEEDVIVASRKYFREEDLCNAMQYASFNASMVAKPIWGLIEDLTLDEDGVTRVQEEMELVFGHQGSIRDCGIPNVEEECQKILYVIEADHGPLRGGLEEPLEQILSESQKKELVLRDLLRGYRDEITYKHALVEDAELERVLFDVMYPSFGARQRQRQ